MSRRSCQGFTLVEVLVSALIGAVIATGTLAAFVAAARMMRAQDAAGVAEAAGFAVQTADRLRNMVACDSAWFTPPCNATQLPTNWTTDLLVYANTPIPSDGLDGRPYDGGTASIMKKGAVRRCYRVNPEADCGGACYKVEVAVCWADLSTCPCPAS